MPGETLGELLTPDGDDSGNHPRPPALRASDAERERTQELLRDAAAEGRLTFEELADRIDAAGRATTREELERLTADLPVGTGGAIVPPASTPRRPRRRRPTPARSSATCAARASGRSPPAAAGARASAT